MISGFGMRDNGVWEREMITEFGMRVKFTLLKKSFPENLQFKFNIRKFVSVNLGINQSI